MLAATWRMHTINDHAFGARTRRLTRGPVVFVVRHGHMLPMLYHHRNRGVAILISEHRDGEMIARVAASLGFQTVRGSTSRGAARALVGLGRALASGHDVAITPDGPRGPAGSFAPGALVVAQRARVPVVAVAARASRAWRLGTWDQFLIPKPFARVTVAYSDAMLVVGGRPRDVVDDVTRFRETLSDLERVMATHA